MDVALISVRLMDMAGIDIATLATHPTYTERQKHEEAMKDKNPGSKVTVCSSTEGF